MTISSHNHSEHSITEAITQLSTFIRPYKRVLVAFSGGVDSTLVAYLSQMTLGRENTLAITAVSPALADKDLSLAKTIAQQFHIKHICASSNEIHDDQYQKNDKLRCYHCKSHLYTVLYQIAHQHNFVHIANGNNYSDLADYRPGLKAADKAQILSPLAHCKIDKATVRAIAKKFDLPNWDRPASPCLASRIPYGQKVTIQKLNQIERAEQILHKFGCRQFRIRHHEDIARIECSNKDYAIILNPQIREQIEAHIRKLGFLYVCIDLKTFASGRLNQALLQTKGNLKKNIIGGETR